MTLQLTVPDMSCSSCGTKITKAIQLVDPAATVQANPKTKQVQVETLATAGEIKQAIADAGYTVE